MGSMLTYNFSTELDANFTHPQMTRKEFKDTRNGIVSFGLVPGIDSYLNYLDTLLKRREDWVSVGYLDLGMIPLIVGPSILHNALARRYIPLFAAAGLKFYPMPTTSFMLSNPPKGLQNDYWVFREDAAKFVGVPADRVTTRMLFQKLRGEIK